MTDIGKPAATVTVADTLVLLDGQNSRFADGFLSGGYALWVGAAISKDRVDDLPTLVGRVLEHLRSNALLELPASRPFGDALGDILRNSGVSDAEIQQANFQSEVDTWPCRDHLIAALTAKYSLMLDTTVAGYPPDYLVWNAVDVSSTYGPRQAQPDIEHVCIALLVLEGIIHSIFSANWDCLIEEAMAGITAQPENRLPVLLMAQDLQIPLARPRLYKFHGCARRASESAEARAMLIGRQSQITSWPTNQAFNAMRTEILAAATSQRTLMIGMSAQDSNILNLFANASSNGGWSWPYEYPPFLFAGNSLTAHQETMLKVAFQSALQDHAEEIYQDASIRVYAKALFVASVIFVLFRKLATAAESIQAPAFAPTELDRLVSSLVDLRDATAALADSETSSFVQMLLIASTFGMAVFTGSFLSPAIIDNDLSSPFVYQPLSNSSLDPGGSDTTLQSDGRPELAGAIAVLAGGVARGIWKPTFTWPGESSSGVVNISAQSGPSRVFFVLDELVALRVTQSRPDLDFTAGDVVVVHSRTLSPTNNRSPRSQIGRTGQRRARHVSMADLLLEATGLDDLTNRFRQAATV